MIHQLSTGMNLVLLSIYHSSFTKLNKFKASLDYQKILFSFNFAICVNSRLLQIKD